MTVPESFELPIADTLPAATEAANGWRGRCVILYSRAEILIGQALLRREPTAKLPMLISKKVERLHKLGGADELLSVLESFGRLLVERTALTHGSGKLWIAGKGKWLLTLEWLSSRGAERRIFTGEEASNFHKELRTAVQHLERALKSEANSRTPDPADTPSA